MILIDGAFVPRTDVYQKYLEQETARLLEESGRGEDDEDIDLLVSGACRPLLFYLQSAQI